MDSVPGIARPTAADANSLVLGLDSCGVETTLALVALPALSVVREVRLGARLAGSQLTAALREVLGPVRPAELRAIVVVRGPGSFTGMRIGLSAAKALSDAAGVPLVAVSRLAVMSDGAPGAFVALDAGRGNVYLREPAEEGSPMNERMLTLAEAHARLAEARFPGLHGAAPTALCVCEDRAHALLPEARRVAEPTALDAVRHARERVMAADWDDTETLDALYLWRPEQMLGPRATAS